MRSRSEARSGRGLLDPSYVDESAQPDDHDMPLASSIIAHLFNRGVQPGKNRFSTRK
jgi:hypothetical protein